MRKILLLLGISLSLFVAKGQLISDSTAMQALYTNQVFYSLDNGEVANINNNNWDIAFSVSGNGAAGSAILLNEATTSLWAFPGDTSQWNSFDTTGCKTWKRLLNSDTSWTNGAFNAFRGAAGAFDMGWGILNPNNNFWTFGDSLYLIKLSDNTFRKLKIISLKTGVWDFKYANLNGTNLQSITLAKTNYPNKNFVYHSLLTNQTIDREPNTATWDLSFYKHTDLVTGIYTSVSSVFTNKKVWTAKSRTANYTAAIAETSPQTAYSRNVINIGREWKNFKSATGWKTYDSIAYFVFDNDSTNLYRVVFTKFGGSGNGKTFFVKEKLSTVGIKTNSQTISLSLYPNPVNTKLNVLINYSTNSKAELEIFNIDGKLIKHEHMYLNQGLNEHQIWTSELSSGIYLIKIKSQEFNLSQKFIKQ